MSKLKKTNAMRQLDAAKIHYEIMEYVPDENDLSGVHIAAQIGLPCEQVFKTLVTRGDKTGIVVFCIPADKEIDLKAAASVTGNKSIVMMHCNELLANTGYIRGGVSICSIPRTLQDTAFLPATSFGITFPTIKLRS